MVPNVAAAQSVAAAHHGGVQGALWVAAVVCAGLGAALAIALWACRINRRALRSCPVCSAAAVRSVDEEIFSAMHAAISLECGQCGTWRRVLTTPGYARLQTRALRRDRATIIDGIERLVVERRRDDIAALNRALRCDIVGAEDLLELTRRRQRMGQG